MTQRYRFDGEILQSDNPRFASRVALAHSRRIRPYCMCLPSGEGIEVYVARRFEKYHLKRMPNSGPSHAPGCDHYEPHDDLTGLGQLRGQAIIDDEATGETLLKLAFPMSRGPARLAMANANEVKPSVKSDGTKLSIRGLLHYLWNEARLTHWHPKMRGKRGWGLVRNELLRAAEQKITKGKHFSEMLYIPEPFQAAKKYEIARRRREITARAQQHTKQLGLIIGEVKSFDVSINGERIVLKHLPDWNLFLNNVLARRLRSNFEREIELVAQNMGSHLIICATFEMSRADYPHVCELTLMPVNEHWIPYESSEDAALVSQCIEEERHFIKGMRMNLAPDSPIAAVILTDTNPHSTALYHANARASADELSVLGERMAFKGSAHKLVVPGARLPIRVSHGRA
jgi:Protein of unknown function (DUF1173)